MEGTVNPIEKVDNNVILKVFFRMFLGLLATALIAAFTYYSGYAVKVPFVAIAIAELAVVIIFTFLFKKLPPFVVTVLYFVYAILTGVTFSSLFAMYSLSTLIISFFATACLFGGLAAFGYFTKKDISKVGTILMTTLIIGFIVTLINVFLKSNIVDIALDWVILLVFCGLTAFDMQKIKRVANYTDVKNSEKIYVYGAMELYLDFINMFLRILDIVGRFSNRD